MIDAWIFKAYQVTVREDARQNPAMYHATVSRSPMLNKFENFIITLADLRVNDDLAIKHNLQNDRTVDRLKFEIASVKLDDDHQCRVASLQSGLLVKLDCIDTDNPETKSISGR